MPADDYADGASRTLPPFVLPPDAPVNPAFTSGKYPHQQFPFAELQVRSAGNDVAGYPEGANPDESQDPELRTTPA